MDDGVEALVGFVGAHGDVLEFLELAEEVLDEMTPFVYLAVEWQWLGAARMLGDDNLGAAFVELGDDGVAVEGLAAISAPKATPSMSGGTPTVEAGNFEIMGGLCR